MLILVKGIDLCLRPRAAADFNSLRVSSCRFKRDIAFFARALLSSFRFGRRASQSKSSDHSIGPIFMDRRKWSGGFCKGLAGIVFLVFAARLSDLYRRRAITSSSLIQPPAARGHQ